MQWITWMRCRLVSLFAAVAVTLPMGAPSAFAFVSMNDQLSTEQVAQNEEAREDLETDQAWIFSSPTQVGRPLPPEIRRPLYIQGQKIVGGAFTESRAFTLWGPQTDSELEAQVRAWADAKQQRTGVATDATGQRAMVTRLTSLRDNLQGVLRGAPYGFASNLPDEDSRKALLSTPDGRTAFTSRLLEETRFVVVLGDDDEMEPALVSDGVIGTDTHNALIAFGGGFDYRTMDEIRADPGARPRSIYGSVEQLEGLISLGTPGTTAIGLNFLHEDSDLGRGGHIDESETFTTAVNTPIQQVFDTYRQSRLDAAEAKRAKELVRNTTDIRNVRLGPLMSAAKIPEASTQAVNGMLTAAKERGDITDFRIMAVWDDIQIQVNHRKGEDSPAIASLMVDAGTAALQAANTIGLTNEAGKALVDADYHARSNGLGLLGGSAVGTERGAAEQIIVVKANGGGAGTFNVPLYRALGSMDNHPAGRIGRERFRFVIHRIEDVRNGVRDRVTYEFGPGELGDMMILLADHSEFMVTEVYAATGRFAASNPGEPVAKVLFEPVTTNGFTDTAVSPTLYIRSQSGSEAVGAFTFGVAEPWIAPAGADDAYHRVAIPVPLSEANEPPGEGFIHIVAYSYAQYGNGLIPEDRETIDLFDPKVTGLGERNLLNADAVGELQEIFQQAQRKGYRLAQIMLEHGQMDPYLTARGAEALSEATAEEYRSLWEAIPETEKSVAEGGQEDDLVAAANLASGGRTASLIKADAGGRVGHTVAPLHYSLDAEATFNLMQRDGLIASFYHWDTGDDYETFSIHRQGADNNAIHLRSYEAFWRMVWHAQQMGFKWYSIGQDLIGEATRGRPSGDLANLSEQFIEEIVPYLTAADMEYQVEALREGFRVWAEARGEGTVLELPFSGNITGQGPGFAEINLPSSGALKLGVLTSDKTGPAAFNSPLVHTLLTLEMIETLNNAYGGAVVELFNTKKHERIFLDLESQGNIIRKLASNPDTYNFKRVWNKTQAGWDPANNRAYIGDRILMSASTEKLSVISGGEYRGKDDSVIVGVPEIMEAVFVYMRDHVYLTQGDSFGSHYNFPVPQEAGRAVATIHSRAVQSGFWFDVTENDQLTNWIDVFKGAEYREARTRGEEANALTWSASGSEVTPVGVGPARVESSYPLMGSFLAITAEDSRYAVRQHVDSDAAIIQGGGAGQFKGIGFQAGAKAARMAHDVINPKKVMFHPTFFKQGQDGAIAINRFLASLGFDSAEDAALNSAIKLQVFVDADVDQEEAERRFADMIGTVNRGIDSDSGIQTLSAEWFTVVRAADFESADVVIGPSAWLPGVSGEGTVAVAFDAADEGKVRSAAGAFHAAMEYAARGELTQIAAAQLDILQEVAGQMLPQQLDVVASNAPAVEAYQTTVAETVDQL